MLIYNENNVALHMNSPTKAKLIVYKIFNEIK